MGGGSVFPGSKVSPSFQAGWNLPGGHRLSWKRSKQALIRTVLWDTGVLHDDTAWDSWDNT